MDGGFIRPYPLTNLNPIRSKSHAVLEESVASLEFPGFGSVWGGNTRNGGWGASEYTEASGKEWVGLVLGCREGRLAPSHVESFEGFVGFHGEANGLEIAF